ncbi:hypothetical protein JK364_23935 [Streptomyces sp. 110]|uniref:Uncharacterized protein n=1 Tax=Streptomyces endocoffeicus TaxID=2898945 RepID=A0ABS1PTI6_9ACTN|nr:hypothetical protein [Streptomyces endocoffeicus]MBL1115425.1 hypothetical protein [Streptomyces endocoffeicus]
MLREPGAGRPRFSVLVPETAPFDEQLLTRCAAPMEGGAQKGSPRNREKADSAAELEHPRTL